MLESVLLKLVHHFLMKKNHKSCRSVQMTLRSTQKDQQKPLHKIIMLQHKLSWSGVIPLVSYFDHNNFANLQTCSSRSFRPPKPKRLLLTFLQVKGLICIQFPQLNLWSAVPTRLHIEGTDVMVVGCTSTYYVVTIITCKQIAPSLTVWR